MNLASVAIWFAAFFAIAATGCAEVDLEDPSPPAKTKEEIELVRLARTCKGDGYTRAIRAFIKKNGAEASIPYLIHSFGNSCNGCPYRAQLILVEIGAPAVPALIRAVQSNKKDVSGMLTETFALLDPEIVMPRLSQALRGSVAPQRERLIQIVVRLGSKAKGAIPALVWILEEDPDASVDLQRNAAEALCAIGPDAGVAGKAVIHYLEDLKLPNDKRPARRRSVSEPGDRVLPLIPPPRTFLLRENRSLLAALGKLGPDADGVLDYLLAEIAGTDKDSTFAAIATMGPAAGRARPALLAALKTSPPDMRPEISIALCKTGEPFLTVSPFVLADLKDGDSETQVAGIITVQKIGSAAREVLPELLKATSSSNYGVRKSALTALPAIEPPSQLVMPHLIDLLKSNDPEYLDDIIDCLEKFGPDANPAIPRIVELLVEKTWRIRGDVHRNPRPAAMALPLMGTPPKAAIPGLIKLLSDEDWVVQSTASELLAGLGKDSLTAVPKLRELLKVPPSTNDTAEMIDRRDAIAKSLFVIEPESETNEELIAQLLETKDPRTRLSVASFFWQASKYKDRCIQELAAGLSHESVSVRELAAKSLAAIGSEADAAKSALHNALDDDESTVRVHVKAALKKLEK